MERGDEKIGRPFNRSEFLRFTVFHFGNRSTGKWANIVIEYRLRDWPPVIRVCLPYVRIEIVALSSAKLRRKINESRVIVPEAKIYIRMWPCVCEVCVYGGGKSVYELLVLSSDLRQFCRAIFSRIFHLTCSQCIDV